jgi:peptide/nickel transport system permease protein
MSEVREFRPEDFTKTGAEAGVKRRTGFADFFIRLVREKPLGTFGAVVVVILLFAGIFADQLAPYGYNESHVVDRLQGPSTQYLLGTDNMGRDILSRVIYGARISVVVGLSATAISIVISIIGGLTSGFIGGKFDLIFQRFVDAYMGFPTLVILIVLVSLTGVGLWQIILVLGLQYGIVGIRSVRGPVIAVKNNMYVDAAKATGCSLWRVLGRHILPNIMASIIIFFTLRVPGVIMTEAALSFLGFGIPPPEPSWGGMLSGSARTYMIRNPWMAVWPGLALAVTIYGINMFGDAVRDLLDPRMRGGVGRYTGVKVLKVRKKKRAELSE